MAGRWWDWGRRRSNGGSPDSALEWAGAGMPAKVYVRASLERAEITEEYSVGQRSRRTRPRDRAASRLAGSSWLCPMTAMNTLPARPGTT